MSVNLMRTPEELEADYLEIVRNMSFEMIAMVEGSQTLPEEYRGKEHFKVQTAHAVYWQIRALRKEPGVTAYHPV
jgi:hypothetical protein